MITTNLFATPIQQIRIVPTEEEYNGLNTLLYSIFDKSADNAWALESGKSTGEHDLYLYNQPEARWLMEATYYHVLNFWETLKYRTGSKIVFTSAWANLHKQGQVTGEHSHCGGAIKAHISSVFYFKKPEESGNIEFVDPLEYIHKMTPAHQYDETNGAMYKEINAKQFDLLLFPSWLKHRVQPNKTNEDRVAISMNFIGLY